MAQVQKLSFHNFVFKYLSWLKIFPIFDSSHKKSF